MSAKPMPYFGKVTVMRNVLIGLLLAGAAATPAIAGSQNWSDRQQTQTDRHQAQNDRPRPRRASTIARRRALGTLRQPAGVTMAPRVDQQSQARQQVYDRQQFDASDAERATRMLRSNATTAWGKLRERIDQRQQDVRDNRDFRQQDRPVPNVMRDRHMPVVSNTPRPGTEPPLRGDSQRVRASNWNYNWQHNGDHDWRRYRDHHRSLFHLGFYIDPFGWGISPTGSDTGCGQIITATSSGSIRPSTACLTLLRVRLGPLLERCGSGRSLHRHRPGRDSQLLLVDFGRSIIEGALPQLRQRPFFFSARILTWGKF